MSRSEDLGKRKKMEPHNHRAPVGREVCAMESIRQAHSQKNCNDLRQHDKQIPSQDGSRGCASCRVLPAEHPASSKHVDRARWKQQGHESKEGTGESVEYLGLSQAPPEPARSKHRLHQRAAARADHSLRLRRQIQSLALDGCAAIQSGAP